VGLIFIKNNLWEQLTQRYGKLRTRSMSDAESNGTWRYKTVGTSGKISFFQGKRTMASGDSLRRGNVIVYYLKVNQ